MRAHSRPKKIKQILIGELLNQEASNNLIKKSNWMTIKHNSA